MSHLLNGNWKSLSAFENKSSKHRQIWSEPSRVQKVYFWPQKICSNLTNGLYGSSISWTIYNYFTIYKYSSSKSFHTFCSPKNVIMAPYIYLLRHWNISHLKIENPKSFCFLTNWCGLSFTFIIPPPSKEIYGSKIILGKGTYSWNISISKGFCYWTSQ